MSGVRMKRTYVKRTDEIFTSLTYFWALVKPRMSPPKNPSTFEKIQLIVQMNVHYAYLVRSFCSPCCEPNITGRFLELHPEYHTNIKHDLLKFWAMVNAVTQNRHFQPFTTKFTQPGAHCPVLFPWPCRCGVRASRPGGRRSLLPYRNTELT